MKPTLALLSAALLAASVQAQDSHITWHRSDTAAVKPVTAFRSNHALDLETAETLSKNNWEFQIYHRFVPPISNGYRDFYGLDGPVNMRIGLGYAATDRLMITLARSNVLDNIDLRGKYQLLARSFKDLPFLIAVQAGVGWNTNIAGRDNTDGKNFQYYAQAILNTLIRKKVGIGVVPSYLYNSNLFSDDYEHSFALGMYGEYYLLRRLGLLFEYNTVLSGYRRTYDGYALGFELQTAGHFFKIFVTNNLYLNPSQYLTGADLPFKTDEWRLAFNITRLLAF